MKAKKCKPIPLKNPFFRRYFHWFLLNKFQCIHSVVPVSFFLSNISVSGDKVLL